MVLRKGINGEELDEDERILKLKEKKLYKIAIGMKKGKVKDILAFDDDTIASIDRDKIDWNRIIERNILNKIGVIFEAMGWNNEFEVKIPSKLPQIKPLKGKIELNPLNTYKHPKNPKRRRNNGL